MEQTSTEIYESNLCKLYDLIKGHSVFDALGLLSNIDFLVKCKILYERQSPHGDHRLSKANVRYASTVLLECLNGYWGLKTEDTTFIWEIVWYEVKKGLEEEREVG